MAADVVAGLTLVAIAVPEQMATARLVNMPAVAGLYAFVAGSLLYALIGCNSRMSVGADSTIAPVLAAGVAAVAAVGTPRYAHLVSLLALIVGALVRREVHTHVPRKPFPLRQSKRFLRFADEFLTGLGTLAKPVTIQE